MLNVLTPLALAIALGASPAKAAPPAGCLPYDVEVTLTGVIVEKTYPGPPEYHSIKEGDEPSASLIFIPEKPVCAWMDPAPEEFTMNHTEYDVREIQMAFHESYGKAASLIHTKVEVTGELYSQHTIHHGTRVLIFVREITQLSPVRVTRDLTRFTSDVEVNLKGTIIETTFPGPPGYHSVKEGDQPETTWILIPEYPVCQETDTSDSQDTCQVQLAGEGLWKFRNLADIENIWKSGEPIGPRVKVTGMLFPKSAMYHRTGVVIYVNKIKVIPDPKAPRLRIPKSLSSASEEEGNPGCLLYDDPLVLQGVIVEKTYPGPPRYHSLKEGDEPETHWILIPDNPLCAWTDSKPDEYTTHYPAFNVTELQLALPPGGYDEYAHLAGQKVLVAGELFSQSAIHHRTRALVRVVHIKQIPSTPIPAQ